MQSKQEVSIIIPHFNQFENLLTCIHALKEQNGFNADEYEIIVVDDGSDDSILKKDVEKMEVNFMQTEGYNNPYICRNLGVKQARFPTLAFLDASCIPDKEWLNVGVNRLEKNNLDIIAGSFDINYSAKDYYSLAFKLMYLDNAQNIPKGGAVPAGNFFTTKSVFDKIGLFNEESRSGGDTEWSIRARDKNLKIGYAESAKAKYPGKNKSNFYKDVSRYGKGARSQWLKRKGWLWTNLVAISQFLPMSPTTFIDKVNRLQADLSTKQKLLVFQKIWSARFRFGLAMLGL